MAEEPKSADEKGGATAPAEPRQFFAEVYKDGIHTAGWFETIDAATSWIESKKPDWSKVSTREAVKAQLARQDAILKSMGTPRIQRWVKR